MRLAVIALAAWLAGASSALACACCTNAGERHVATVALDSGKRQEIQNLRFGGAATLFTGEADAAEIRGITTPAVSYNLAVTRRNDHVIFAFRDSSGHAGTLSLAEPGTMAIFEVDPRRRPDQGNGPDLYKEWTLTAPAVGSGIFSAGIGAGQSLSLILHGGGNNCTSATDFSHWTLVMRGPKANYTLFGDLRAPDDIGSHGDPISPGSAVDSRVGACPADRSRAAQAGRRNEEP